MMRRWRQFPQIGGKRGGIPSGWVEVEYIGTPYAASGAAQHCINTGIVVGTRNDLLITCDAKVPRPIQYSSVFVSYAGEQNEATRLICDNGSTSTILVNYRRAAVYSTRLAVNITERHTYRLGYNYFTVDGVSFTMAGIMGGANNNPLCVFTRFDGTYAYSAERLVYSFKVDTTGGEHLIDLVPVRNTTTNEGAMCDILTGDIYRNQGTGAFAVGPDKAAWVNPYVTDGLVAMWDGEWNAGGGAEEDKSATVWKDIVGDKDLTMSLTGGSAWGDKCVNFVGNSNPPSYGFNATVDSSFADSVAAVEIVFKAENKSVNGQALSICGRQKSVAITPVKDKYLAFGYGNNKGFSFSDVSSGHSAHHDFGTLDAVVDGETKQLTIYCGRAFAESGIFVGGSGVAYQGYHGQIYCIRLYNRALTPAEVAANFAVDKARFNIA